MVISEILTNGKNMLKGRKADGRSKVHLTIYALRPALRVQVKKKHTVGTGNKINTKLPSHL